MAELLLGQVYPCLNLCYSWSYVVLFVLILLTNPFGGQPLFPGESGVDQLVEIIKVDFRYFFILDTIFSKDTG